MTERASRLIYRDPLEIMLQEDGILNDDEKTVNTGGEIMSSLLPDAAGRILREASLTPLDPTSRDPGLARRKAIDRAHEQVKARWPILFAK